jgi:DNA-binding FadR family transcriptional regulator
VSLQDDALWDEIQPLAPQNTNQVVQARLTQFIERRKLGPGDQLPSEGKLSQALGVSRATLREAMRAMEASGILEARAGSGWYVKDFSFGHVAKGLAYSFALSGHSLVDLREIRLYLETAFLPEAMRTLTPDDLAGLEREVQEMERLAEAGQLFVDHDRAFHTMVFGRVRNELLSKLMDMFWTLGFQFVRASLPKEDLISSAVNHRLALAAIRSGDVDLARWRLRESFEGPPPFWSTDQPEQSGQ